MIDILAGIFGDLMLDKARGEMGPVSPIPRTLAGSGGDGIRLKALEREHERLKLITMALWEVMSVLACPRPSCAPRSRNWTSSTASATAACGSDPSRGRAAPVAGRC